MNLYSGELQLHFTSSPSPDSINICDGISVVKKRKYLLSRAKMFADEDRLGEESNFRQVKKFSNKLAYKRVRCSES